MNTTTPPTTRPLNDATIATTQRAFSQTLGGLLSPLEARLAKGFQSQRDKPLVRPFCNIFERHLKVELDQQNFIWSDTLRLNARLIQAIEAAAISEDEKNEAVFWLVLFYTSYFALGYQTRCLKAPAEQQPLLNLAQTQAVLHHMRSLGIQQPANAPHWEQNGYVFKALMALEPGPKIAEEALGQLEQGAVAVAEVTHTPLLQLTDLNGCVASLQEYSPQVHETFAQEIINDWVAEFMKTNDFGSEGFNGIRLLYFKANAPRDASEAIMDCLRSRYPAADDLALYDNRKLANDYFAPRKADPIEEKTGHLELFIDCSGSISAGDIGDCLKVFRDFFAKRKKNMTYGMSCFDTGILSRIEAGEGEDPVEKLSQLSGSDLNNQVQYSFPAEGEDGVALVPARKLLGFAKTLQGQELQAESTPEKGLTFTTESIELALPGLPPDDFPRVPSPTGATFKVDQTTFCRALRMTVFAAAVEDDRHVLRGCYLHFTEGHGRVVATDSRRLALVQFTPTAEPSDPNAQFIIPSAIAKLLLTHLTGESEVTCTAGEKQVGFECATPGNGRYRLIFSKLEGNYPNYSRFIQPLQRENTISREALLQALKRASAAVEEKEGTVDLQFEGRRLVIKAQTTCKFHEALEMDYKGSPFTTVFAPRYISEALEESPEDEVKFDLQGPQAPLVMQGHNFMYLAMPRRIN